MSRQNVVITDFINDDLQPERKILGELADVTSLGAVDEHQLSGKIEQADALIVYHELGISRETIERLERCKLIVRAGVGFDNVDGPAARERAIPLATVPDYGCEEVADHAIGLALSLVRGIGILNSRLRAGQGEWSYQQVVPLTRLRGKTFGVVGLGRIGTPAALRAKALGMDVVYYDPCKQDGYDKSLGIRRVESLDELLGQSLIVSMHCPLTDETRRMIDAAAIERMPRGSYLINTSRGGVVDSAAIPAAIASGRLAGAGIDVLQHEPPADDHPLLAAWRDPNHPAHDRLILTPHSAFYSEEGLMDIRVKTAEACVRAFKGLPLRNVVN